MADLEYELRELGSVLVVPDPPDVRADVRARIGVLTERPAAHRRRWLAAVAALAVAIGLAASPHARAALAEVVRFAGVDVHWGDTDAPTTPESPLPGERAVKLDAARDRAAFPIGVPTRLGAPDRVQVADSARVVSLLYGSGRDAIRLDEFEGRWEPIFEKTIMIEGVSVDVGAEPGYWLPGPHAVRYVDRDGHVHDETARLAGNTLLWQSAGVTYRLEGGLSRAEAVAIAASMR
ncbi:MAG TPA: hypothetical protein VEX15_20720 [Nocardioidaceae bacterium]|nr:hypothetical protein [Nocardioidaceae bacterium]